MYKRESRGAAGNTRWLVSAHGVWNAKTEAITVADFADEITDGVLPSGTAITVSAAGEVAPYDGATLTGFVLFDQRVDATETVVNVPVIKHGIIDATQLPGEFAAPTNTNHGFVFDTDVAPTEGGE